MTKIHNIHLHPIIARILPFLILGIVIILFIFSLIVFWYIFVIGLIIGLIAFVYSYIREKLFRHKKHRATKTEKIGIIIEHDKDPD